MEGGGWTAGTIGHLPTPNHLVTPEGVVGGSVRGVRWGEC